MKKSLGPKTILFPTPVMIVGTYDQKGKPNAAAVAWGGICCSQPPCLWVSLRPATQSYHNILNKKAFTVNVPSVKFAKEADYFGLVSGRDDDKFATTGLTPVMSDMVDAPFIQEFPLVIECRLKQTTEIGSHLAFIGEVLDVKADEKTIGSDGMPLVEKIEPFAFTPGQRIYNVIGEKIGAAFSLGMRK